MNKQFDIYTTGYGTIVPYSSITSSVFKFINNQSDPARKLEMLDIGCGVGGNMFFSAFFPNLNYTGIDISEVAIDRARKNIYMQLIQSKNSDQKIKHINISTEEFMLRNSTEFDLIIDRASLQHHQTLSDELDLSNSVCEDVSIFNSINNSLSTAGQFLTLWSDSDSIGCSKNFSSYVRFSLISNLISEAFIPISLIRIRSDQINSPMGGGLSITDEMLFVGKKKLEI